MLRTLKRDKEGTIALLVLVVVILAYLVGMYLWIMHERNIPVREYKIIDVGGNVVAAKVTVALHKWLNKRNKG
jgi:hypothetical protein